MGGFGSGKAARRKAWRSKKRYITSLPEIPVSKLIHAKRGDVDNQSTFGRLKCEIHPFSIHLEHDEQLPLDISEIEISAFPCHYGGYRYYGLCPACDRCARSLYVLDGTIPVCRICLGMVYSSQNATLSYRLYRKVRSVKNKLNNDEWTKPKWMRKKTFEQLRTEISELDEKREIANFFSLRNHRSVNRIYDEYGSAIAAAEMLGGYL
ncbi:MAG TPA: hypothetical protein VFU89_01460 [Rhabdochlamydiaceae bacterium]|nr:hypothetical protein [Rhabdochlamydiaceae bacterium]